MNRKVCLFVIPILSIALFGSCNNTPISKSSYHITYSNLDGSNPNNPDKYNYNETLVLNDPSDHGYEFTAWRLNNGAGEIITEIKAGTTGDLVLYAEWGDLNQYTINYDFKGGSGTTTETYTVIDIVTIDNDPTTMAPGYQDFLGWYDENDNVVTGWTAGEKIGEVNLFAKYKDPYTYNITFDPGEGVSTTTCINLDYCDGESPERRQVELESTQLNPYKAFPAKERNGYLFNGWYHDSSYTDIVETGDKINYNDTLYAKWQEGEQYGTIVKKEEYFCYFANIYPYIRREHVSHSGFGSVPYGVDKVIFDLDITSTEFFEPRSLLYKDNDIAFYTWDTYLTHNTTTKDVAFGDYIKVEFDAEGCTAADEMLENFPYCVVGTRLVYDNILLDVNNSSITLPVTYGSVFENPPSDPTCAGKTFVGWTYNDELVDLTKPWQIAENATLVAKYE